jgi:predicted phosphodiesterase
MKRTKKRAPASSLSEWSQVFQKLGETEYDAIFTADWHLRDTVPSCRTDDFITAQWGIVREVAELQRKYKCPVIHAGDLFHHWKPSPELLTRCIQELPNMFWTVYGNHDLPQHNMDLEYKSGVRTLIEAGKVKLLDEGHWNHPPSKGIKIGNRRVGVWHNMVWTNKAPFPGAEEEDEGHKLLDDFPQFDIIITGDNHQQFICKKDGRILLNTGNLTRQTAAQIDFEPCVWLYKAEVNMVIAYYFGIDPDAVTRVYIEDKAERDDRIDAFVERLNTGWEGVLDFDSNVRQLATKNKISDNVMNIVYKALDT